jgi:hypothetical protein
MRKVFNSIPCEIYWWNMGNKKLEHRGSVQEYFTSRSITVRRILSPSKEMYGFRFKISCSSCSVTLDTFQTLERAAMDAIKLYLSMMGDKSTVKVGYIYYKINWR